MSDPVAANGGASGSSVADGSRPKQRIGRNVLIMTVSFVGNYMASFATFPYLTRVLGPTHFGILSYAMAIAAYGTLFTEWGFSLSGPKAAIECRNEPRALNRLIWSIAGAKACLCLVSLVALMVLLRFDGSMASSGKVILWSWLGVIGNVFTLYWLFQGLERFYLIGVMVFANRLVTLPLTFLLVRHPDDVVIAAAIQAAGPVVAAFLSVAIGWRLGLIRRPDVSWRAIRERLVQGSDMFVATASVTLFGAANMIILASLAGPYQVGIYAAADKIKTVGNLVPAQISAVLYPRISGLFAEQKRAAAKLTVIGAVATVVMSLASLIFFGALSAPLTKLVLGKEFHGASPVLLVLCCSTLFGNLAYFLGLQVLVPFGKSRKRSFVMLLAGCVNIALAFLFVPHLGAQGAALSFLIAEAVILAIYLVSIFREPELRAYFSLLLTPRVAGLFDRRVFFGKFRSDTRKRVIDNANGHSNQAARRQPIRVLHVGPGWGQRGGIASVLLELTLQREQFEADGVSLAFFETHGFNSLKSLLSFILFDLPRFALLMMRGADVVHFHVSVKGSFYRKFMLWVLARLRGTQTIFHLHAGNFSQFEARSGKLTKRAVAWFVRGAAATVAVSAAVGNEMRDFGADGHTLHIIGNTARQAETASHVKLESTTDDGKPYIAFAGRLTEVKGLADLFKAVALLKENGCFVELRLAGDGDINCWKQVALDYGIDDRVIFMGWLDGDAKLAFYRRARVFCMPSHHESFGITTLEAMFSGVPVVGTQLGGFLDLVEEGVTGYLVESRAPDALASRLRVVIENPLVAAKMGRAGLARARRLYSTDAIVNRYIHCYNHLTRRSGGCNAQ